MDMAGRLSPTNQEHCVVYNMIRLADYLFRWTGEVAYLDYIERNILNGLFAQQNARTGMVAYYLPLHAGAVKKWGTPTGHFWCCHGTVVQAQTLYADLAFYESGDSLTLAQFIPSTVSRRVGDATVAVEATTAVRRADSMRVDLHVRSDRPCRMLLRVRIPDWVTEYSLTTGAETVPMTRPDDGFLALDRTWSDDKVSLRFPRAVRTCPLPGEPGTVAFLHGPVVLAGLCDEERTVRLGGKPVPELFRPFDDTAYDEVSFSLKGQERGMRFVPLNSVLDEKYTVYFPTEGDAAP